MIRDVFKGINDLREDLFLRVGVKYDRCREFEFVESRSYIFE